MELMEIYHPVKEPSARFATRTKLVQTVETALTMFAVYAQHHCVKIASIWIRMNIF